MTSMPTPPEYPPKPPRGSALRRWWLVALVAALVVIAAIAVAVSVSGGATDDTTTPKPVPATPVEPSPESNTDQLTRTAVDLAWDAFTPEQQQAACVELALVGDEEAARLMEEGAGPDLSSDAINWDLAVDIIKAECSKL